MPYPTELALRSVERGLVPDPLVRIGIRRLLKARLAQMRAGATDEAADLAFAFLHEMREAALAPLPEKANEQHYEVPAAFFGEVLGAHRKYSCGYWPEGVKTLAAAEAAALDLTCARAGLADGQDVLELGCGWGSLTLWMATQYPGSRITALSNSHSQRAHIEAEAERRGLTNVRVLTCDINVFDTATAWCRSRCSSTCATGRRLSPTWRAGCATTGASSCTSSPTAARRTPSSSAMRATG